MFCENEFALSSKKTCKSKIKHSLENSIECDHCWKANGHPRSHFSNRIIIYYVEVSVTRSGLWSQNFETIEIINIKTSSSLPVMAILKWWWSSKQYTEKVAIHQCSKEK